MTGYKQLVILKFYETIRLLAVASRLSGQTRSEINENSWFCKNLLYRI